MITVLFGLWFTFKITKEQVSDTYTVWKIFHFSAPQIWHKISLGAGKSFLDESKSISRKKVRDG